MRTLRLGAACCLLAAGCYVGHNSSDDAADFGTGADGTADDGADTGPPPDAPEMGGVGIVGLRRLSRNEFDNTLRDLLGDDTRPATAALPEDAIDPFDNDYRTQDPTPVLIESLEAMATDVAARVLADQPRLDEVVGCAPVSTNDAACMGSFVESFGRKALRRQLTTKEIDDWTALGLDWAGQQSDFYQGVDAVLRVLLQHPHFLYRVEVGTPTQEPGVFVLNDYEVATRLSYFIWGSTPDDQLLDFAEAGELSDPAAVGVAAEWMLNDPRARERIDRMHAMWLGYYSLPHDEATSTSMRTESRMLLEDVIFNNPRAYSEVFTATGTYLNDTLAQIYGLPSPGGDEFVWTEYGDSGRAGLLGQGSFLSVAAKFGDTSPTQRGLLIRTRLLCQGVPEAPPTVDVDNPPQSPDSNCKWDRYEAHRSDGACFGCHEQIDPIGFGLEQFDQMGRFRTVEEQYPECTITGEGSIDGSAFSGPAGLSQYVVDNGLLESCFVSQVYRFAMGHEAGDPDARYVDDLREAFEGGGQFEELVMALVEDEAFGFRREEN